MLELVKQNLDQAISALDVLRQDEQTLELVSKAAMTMTQALSAGRSVYSCGNGGSMCDAMHFAEELSGKFRKERRALAAMAISDPAHLSCTANDFGYDQVFARFIEAHGREGDVLLAISTSGSSPNILLAAEVAKKQGVKVIGLTGNREAKLGAHCNIHLATPGGTDFSDRVQELHIKLIHTMIDIVEAELFR